MKSVLPKYIQWTKRWKDDGSGTGRKSMGWDGGEGNSRGRRFAGIVNVNCGEEERREGEGDLYGVSGKE